MTKPRISASLMAADGARLGETMAALAVAGVDSFHWDIMDGHFVPNLTFGPGIVKSCRRLSALEFDVHLMVTDPSHWITPFVDAGADCLDIHVELGDVVSALVADIKKQNCRVGLAVNPETPLEAIDKMILSRVDRLVLMSVRPGFGGQEFIDITAKIKQAAQWCDSWPHLDITVDGGINAQTAARVCAAGAMTLVSGSGLLGADTAYEVRLKHLREACV